MRSISYDQFLRICSSFIIEGPCRFLELSSFLLLPFLKQPLPYGNSDAVILIPGFTEDDSHMYRLQALLVTLGYRASTWGRGKNIAEHENNVRFLMMRVRELHQETGRRVHLVGHSLGGLYAIYLGHVMRKHVASVVTMGSPVNLNVETVSPLIAMLFEALTKKTVAEHLQHPRFVLIRTPPTVPTTTIAAHSDQVVGMSSCIFPSEYAEASHVDSILTYGTHRGHLMSLATFMAIFHHLAYVHDPQPYDPYRYFNPYIVSCLYPSKSS